MFKNANYNYTKSDGKRYSLSEDTVDSRPANNSWSKHLHNGQSVAWQRKVKKKRSSHHQNGRGATFVTSTGPHDIDAGKYITLPKTYI